MCRTLALPDAYPSSKKSKNEYGKRSESVFLKQQPSARLAKGSFNGSSELGVFGPNGRLVSAHDCTVPAN
jgi:hypothetical protein